MRIWGIFPGGVTMNMVVRVLKDRGDYERAHRFYKDWCDGLVEVEDLDLDSMVDGSSSSDDPVSFKHFVSTELFKTGEVLTFSSGIEGSTRKPRLTSTFNMLIDLNGKAGRLKDEANVFGEMLRSGVEMDVVTFNTMIFTCGSHGCLSEAEALLAKMEEKRISPNTTTYNIFLSLCAEVGDVDRALECYRKIREVGLYPDVVSRRVFFHMVCQRNMVRDVEMVIEDVKKNGTKIDENSVLGVIKIYVNNGLGRAKSILEKCQRDGGFSSKTYAAITDAYAEMGLGIEAEAAFLGKRDPVGERRSVVEYNVMVKAFGKARLYDKAFTPFKGMRNHGMWPEECTYDSLIQMFSKGDLVDRVRELLGEMQGMGVKPSCNTFSAVIACYSRLGWLSDTVDTYQNMLSTSVKPNEYIYRALVDGFAESGSVEEAFKYFRRMEESGLSANQTALTSLMKAYGRVESLEGAKSLYDKIRGFEGGPDIVASNTMIHLYSVLGMVSEAKTLFEDLRRKNSADEFSFSIVMNLYKSMAMFAIPCG